MCGIAGMLVEGGTCSADDLAERVGVMAEALRHRGPDADGLWVDADAGVGLGHRRLSIQDLSHAGDQPMRSASGRYQLIFNGEIYNFHALRRDLEYMGHTFIGHSDTEVLLGAIEAWGLKAALQRAVGMFALALWDTRDQTLHLARDRMGEKPLYYGWCGSRFCFASELKAFEACRDIELALERSSVSSLLRFGYIVAPLSIYQGIYKLPPGCLLSVSSGRAPTAFAPYPDSDATLRPRRYWSLLERAQVLVTDTVDSVDDALDSLDELLTEVLKGQIISDVPLAAFLSSGYDSATVVAFMQKVSAQPVRTFTVGFEDRRFDESAAAAAIAAHLGTEHTRLSLSDREALDLVPQLPSIYDEPFADASQIPTSLLSRLVRQHATVCLTGDGGDELFGGYNRYWWGLKLWRHTQWLPAALRTISGRALAGCPAPLLDGAFALAAPLLPSSARGSQVSPADKLAKVGHALRARNFTGMYRSLNSYWQDPAAAVPQVQEPINHVRAETAGSLSDPVHRMFVWDQLGYLADDNLVKVDRASMAVSLETRLPLLDHRLVELSWRVPVTMKSHQGQGKWLLRQLLYRYVPRDLMERPKMGFSPPVSEWLRGGLRDWAEALLDRGALAQCGLFDAGIIESVWREHLAGSRDRHKELWPVLMFQAWAAQRAGRFTT